MYKASCNIVFFVGKNQILLHVWHRQTNTKLGLRFSNAIIYIIVIRP